MQRGLGSSTWWEEPEYTQLETAHLRGLFVLDKLIKRDITKFQMGRRLSRTLQVRAQPDSAR